MRARGELIVVFGIISVKILIFISLVFMASYIASLFGYNIVTPGTINKIGGIVIGLWIVLLLVGGAIEGKLDDQEKIFSK